MYKDISRLVSQSIDKETISIWEHCNKPEINFTALGVAESPFIMAILKKFAKLGIKIYSAGDWWKWPFVIDRETSGQTIPYNDRAYENDIDAISPHSPYAMSCDAAAIISVLTEISEFKDAHVCIVGRGHAVKGLTPMLIVNDYTVTQCHSHTKNIKTDLYGCEVIVWTAQEFRQPGKTKFTTDTFPHTAQLILDISNAIPRDFRPSLTVHNIGMVTTSILVNRAVRTFCNRG